MPQPKINILMVDDQEPNLLTLAAVLDNPEYNLVRASSGSAALRCMLKDEFALILLDVQMPIMDGFETASMIRAREKSSYTPIIFITAYNANDTHVTRGYSMGAVDYIFKPVISEILRAKVQVFVELFKKTREVKASAAELARANIELAESAERYRRLFEAAGEAILVADSKRGKIVDLNDAACRLYGYQRGELLELRLGALDASEKTQARQRRKDGSVFPARISETRLFLGGREKRLLLISDMTECLKAAEAEKVLARELMQREFVANVSHELRTPIAAVKGFSETLLRGGLDDLRNRASFVKAIERNADRLGVLVEDLLTLASIESGKNHPSPGEIPLIDFVESYVETIAPLASRKKVSVQIDIPPGTTVRADRKHLTQVLQNLVDNAIKYNRPGGTVAIEGRAEGGAARVSVRDTGIGIAPEDLERLFTRFHRADQVRNMAVSGTGLGLYIIKTIVESNGGRIWAESRRDEGSAFHFTVPLAN